MKSTNSELIPSVDVPEGESREWKIERFRVSKEDAKWHNMMESIRGRGRTIHPGKYTRLMRSRDVVMSDTDSEKRDHRAAVICARGTILINGLGLGMVLSACLLKPEVEMAFVVEKSEDVIALVGGHYRSKFNGRLQIIHDDALEFTPPKGVRFGMVWHDIWDNICADNLPEMGALHRRYGKRADWQGSWCKDLCRP